MHLDFPAKRVRIVIILVTLAVCAFFLAQGTTRVVAAKYLPVGVAADGGGARSASSAKASAPKGSEPPDFHTILGRNIFDPTTGSLWPPKLVEAPPIAGPEGGEGAAPLPLGEGEMPPSCDGQAKLIATIYSERLPAWSFASLQVGGASPLLYRSGSQIDGKSVDSIYPEAVFLKAGNGALCSLQLFVPPGTTPKATATAPAVATPVDAPSPAPGAAPGIYGSSLSEAELDQGITQLSDNRYSVQRGLIDKVLMNQTELMRSARVVPHEENGRVVGVKLYGIRRSSLLGKLGLQNGDMLRTINGFDMASPDAALEAYTKLRTANDLSVNVVRRGSPVTMEYGVK